MDIKSSSKIDQSILSPPIQDHVDSADSWMPQMQQQHLQEQQQQNAHQNIPQTYARTEAEQLAKDRRYDLPRVTCYSTADAYALDKITHFLRK